jgi:hypothetical protein
MTALAAGPLQAAPQIFSRLDQKFAVGASSTYAEPITITKTAGGKTIAAALDLRITIPVSMGATWDPSDTTLLAIGNASAKVAAAITLEGANRTAAVNVLSDFVDGDTVTLYGLRLTGFGVSASAASLTLDVDNDAVSDASDDKAKVVHTANLDSSVPQAIQLTDTTPAVATITVTEGPPAILTAANDIRIRIPSGIGIAWNTADTTVTIGGTASAKVNATTPISFTTTNVLRVNLDMDLAAGETLTLDGLTFGTPSAASSADFLELVADGSDAGATVALDRYPLAVGPPKIEGCPQTVSANGTVLNTLTITDGNADINTADGIRLAIPTHVNLKWSGTQAPTFGGTAASKTTSNAIEDSAEQGKVLHFTVGTPFASGDTLTISGLQVDLVGAPSEIISAVWLLVDGPETVNAATIPTPLGRRYLFQLNGASTGGRAPTAAFLDADSVAAAWYEQTSNLPYRVRAAVYNLTGTLEAGPVTVNANVGTDTDLFDLAVARDPSGTAPGNFIVAYLNSYSDGNVMASRYSAAGTLLDARGVSDDPFSLGGNPALDLAVDSSGTFAVVWRHSASKIFYRAYSGAGTALTTAAVQVDGPGISGGSATVHDPAISTAGTGSFEVTWTNFDDNLDARLMRATVSTTAAGAGVRVDAPATATSSPLHPSTDFSGSTYHAVWDDTRAGNSLALYGNIPDIFFWTGTTAMAVDNSVHPCVKPRLAMTGNALEGVIAWDDLQQGVTLRVFNSNGTSSAPTTVTDAGSRPRIDVWAAARRASVAYQDPSDAYLEIWEMGCDPTSSPVPINWGGQKLSKGATSVGGGGGGGGGCFLQTVRWK